MTAKQFCYLKDLTYKGAHLRYGAELSEEVEKRIRYELSTIEWMGFPGYFLIVWDYIRAAREMGVSVGPGRGSAAGSVVAYCLKNYQHRSAEIRPAVRAFPESRAYLTAGCRCRFRRGRPRRRAALLRAQVRAETRGPDRDVRYDGAQAWRSATWPACRKPALSESDRLAKLVPDKVTPDKKAGETPFDFCYKESPEPGRRTGIPEPVDPQYAQIRRKASKAQFGRPVCMPAV